MVKTVWAALFGTLVMGTGLSAQQEDGVDRNVKRWRSALAEHVTGDYGAAIAELQSQLSESEGLERAELLARLSILEGMLGRAEPTLEYLRELAGMDSPYADWARGQMVESVPRQGPQAAVQDPQIPGEVWRNVTALGVDGNAFVELGKLGSLAIPAIVKALDERHLTAPGSRVALDLIISYEDERVAGVVRRMLESEDPIRQVVASEYIPKLRGAAKRDLGRLALQSEASMVRLRGLEALSDAENLGDVLRFAIDQLLADRSTAVREELAGLLGELQDESLPVDSWLEQLARDDDQRVNWKAIYTWLGRRAVGESARRIEFFESLPRAHAGILLVAALEDERFTDDALLVRAGAFPELFERILSVASEDALAAAPEFLRAVLLAGAREDVLRLIRDKRVDVLVEDVLPLLSHKQDYIKRTAFSVVSALRPELLLARAEEMLAESDLVASTAVLLANHGGPEHMDLVVEALRLGATGYERQKGLTGAETAPLLQALATRSDSSHLDVILDLVTIPDVQIHPNDWLARVGAVVSALNRWFEAESIGPGLARIRTVDFQVAQTIFSRALRVVEARHVPAVIGLLEDMRREGLVPVRFDRDGNQRRLSPMGSKEVAEFCVRILGAAGGEQARDSLRALIRDPELGTRAFLTVLDMEGPPQLELMAEVLASEELEHLVRYVLRRAEAAEDEGLRAAAERRLVGWKSSLDPQARSWLQRLSQEDRRRVCTAIVERQSGNSQVDYRFPQTALVLLGKERDAELIGTLALGLNHANSSVRIAAVNALLQTFSKDVAPHLIETLKDENEEVVEAAQKALARLSEYFAEKEKWEKAFGIKKDG